MAMIDLFPLDLTDNVGFSAFATLGGRDQNGKAENMFGCYRILL
jgi:hypothetical protein